MRIAITGGIAEGKSTVLKFLEARGASIASADAFAKDVFWDPEVQMTLRRILGVDEDVTPAQLRVALATDESLRREVNQLMHPKILSGMIEDHAMFHEVPLLFETCMHPQYDAVWVVACGGDEQRRRLIERYGEDGWTDIMRGQLESVAKRVMADEIIRTDCSLAETEAAVLDAAKRYEITLVDSAG